MLAKNDASDGADLQAEELHSLAWISLADTRPHACVISCQALLLSSLPWCFACLLVCHTAAQLVGSCFSYLAVDVMAFSHASAVLHSRLVHRPSHDTICPTLREMKLTNVIDRDSNHQWQRAPASPADAPPSPLPFAFTFPFRPDIRTSSAIVTSWNEWQCSRYFIRP